MEESTISAEFVSEAVVIEGATERLGDSEGALESDGDRVSVGDSDGELDSDGATLDDGAEDGPIEGDRDALGWKVVVGSGDTLEGLLEVVGCPVVGGRVGDSDGRAD